ncbi:hypothetical protein B5X24_HaOG210650 [Helicoverpa armigera]|nr:hypothetical protein B5X24_HaOG210650 [Helicoverpa armigera]
MCDISRRLRDVFSRNIRSRIQLVNMATMNGNNMMLRQDGHDRSSRTLRRCITMAGPVTLVHHNYTQSFCRNYAECA